MSELKRFGIYIHWPFCAAKCPYCDFNSHVADRIDQAVWVDAYVSEIDRVAQETGPRVVSSIFLGGGTPSLMHAETVDAILSRIRASWPSANDVEITLEANPSSVEAHRFKGYREAGVNRVSLGVQALNDTDLRRLGRLHSKNDALVAIDIAKSVFDRVSFDLIYARQDQTLETWEAELDEALTLAADHLSLYQLTIEPGTAFGTRYARGSLDGLPDEDLEADMYALTQAKTADAGFQAYEISNHARPGAESRHNMIYWTGGDYAGIGPGAHGRITRAGRRIATETLLAPSDWLHAVKTRQTGETLQRELTSDDLLAERLMMGLRITDGVAFSDLPDVPGGDQIINKINILSDIGLVRSEAGRFWATDAGRPVLNAVLRELLA
ncbi:MAG: radical SAM family heme chaperone HemW [Pseudomonadota bacterium]